MEERNKPENNMDKPTGPKFNSYWIYGIIALFLIALQLFNVSNTSNPQISWDRFQDMAKDGAVEKVEVVNLKYAYVHLKSDRLASGKYDDASQSKLGVRPHYIFNIGIPEAFKTDLRGRGAMQGGNDERENTLNQLLVEMDGFSTDKGVILMAATNRHDVLDSALMRPGRFDRQIGIDRPDLKGREAIFRVHLKKIKTGPDIVPTVLAEMTPGFAGADIANICNEAALVAARRNKKAVDLDDFNYALDRVIGGLEKKNKLISPKEKKIIAYHEAGHAICGWFLEHASPLVKVTIVPRGVGTLGYAQYLPKEEYITRTEALLDRMCMTLGGRAAESVVFDKISTGAQSDLDQVTKMAYSMIAVFGMNEKVGNVSFHGMQQDQFNKPYSDDTANMIDEEVRQLIDSQYDRAKALLRDRRNELELLAQQLLTKEVLLKSDVERLVGPRPGSENEAPSANGVVIEEENPTA